MTKTYRINKCGSCTVRMRRNDQAWSVDMEFWITHPLGSKVIEPLDRFGLSPLDRGWFGDELAEIARRKRCAVIYALAGDYNNPTHASTR